MNNQIVRKTNRGRVFKKLVMSSGISRSELAQSLNLTKMSISNIVTEFLNMGLIEEQEKIILGEPHKNPISLNLSPSCPRLIGVQIQREYCKAVLCDFRLNILDSMEVRFDQISLKGLQDALLKMVGKLLESGNILGIGIGCIGPLDVQLGKIGSPPNFGDIKNFAVVEFLEQAFGLPVVLEHHYNCAALAEHYFGISQNANSFLYLGVTKGVGMGMVVNGKLYSSLMGTVAEIGHISLNNRGRICRCGNRGCLERYVSTDVIVEELTKLTGEKKPFREYCRMTEDDNIMEYFYRVMDYMKVVLSGSVNLFRPELIVIGDEGKYFPSACIRYLEEEINRSNLYQEGWHVEVKKTGMNRDLMLVSSAIGILERVFSGELLFE